MVKSKILKFGNRTKTGKMRKGSQDYRVVTGTGKNKCVISFGKNKSAAIATSKNMKKAKWVF